MIAWQGELTRHWNALGQIADPSDRANEAANRVRQQIAQAQATAIEMKKRETEQKRMASSSPVQVGWQKLFEGGEGSSAQAPRYDPAAETAAVAREWKAENAKKKGIDWSKVGSAGVRG